MIDEDDIRTLLHDAAARANAGVGGSGRPADPARYRARIDERARLRRTRAVGGALAAALAVAGAAVVVPGLRGDPATDVATATPRSGAPGWTAMAEAPIEPRFQHTAVAMDGDVLVFGGFRADSSDARGAARYDPASGRWTAVDDPPGDVAGATAVWTGDHVFALDLHGRLLEFDPTDGSWTTGPHSPFAATANAVTAMVWTGREVVVINTASDERATAAYDPTTRRWRRLDAPPFELAFFDAAWTGHDVVAVADTGGSGKSFPRLAVLALDPEEGRWRELPAPPLADVTHRSHGFAIWTGSELVVGGGHGLDATGAVRGMADVAAWTPSSSTWRTLPDAPFAVTGSSRYADAWTGDRAVVWPGGGDGDQRDRTGRPVLLDPVTGAWTVGPALPDGAHEDAPPVWTGRELLVWSGEPSAAGADEQGCCRPAATGFTFTP